MRQILLVAPPEDIHANVVADHIGARAEVNYIDLQACIQMPLEIVPGEYVRSGGQVVASGGTTVWWRRTGYIPPDARTGRAENRLRAEETRAQMVGGLLSIGVRWIDHPGLVQTAEHTLLQLSVARSVGVQTPTTTVTNTREAAQALAKSHRLVAKSISAGEGIAPFADTFDECVVDLLPNAPTLLQQQIVGLADLRVVVVGDNAYVWRRARKQGEPLDWRRPDPAGAEFSAFTQPAVAASAVAITHRLGLTFSAQDWVETEDGNVFLEANPVGQWLFLTGADEIVGSALAEHLLGGDACV